MPDRTSKRSIPPRTTRRGIPPMVDADAETTQFGPPPVREDGDEPEPALSARPTRRDISVPTEVASPRTRSRSRGPRGEFSIPSARGIATDAVAGSIETTDAPRRRRTSAQPVEAVHLASATKREITVVIGDRALTLARHDALALAQIILTTFH